jgi:nucleoside-diphosphate-sugar epimerase
LNKTSYSSAKKIKFDLLSLREQIDILMILITGASGFLGGFLVEEFLKHRFRVRAMVRPTSDLSHLKNTKAEIVLADITNTSEVKNALDDIDSVVHNAAILGSKAKKKEDFFAVNYEATKNLADLCIKKKIKRLTFISSIAAIGPTLNKEEFLDENSQPHPHGYYGESKHLAEEYLLSLSRGEKLEIVIVRPALIYGPRDKRCAVNYFRVAHLGFFPLLIPANNKASFIYVSDAAQAIFLAHTQSKPGEIYMLAHDVVTLKEFATKLLISKGGISLFIPVPRFLINTLALVAGFIYKTTGRLPEVEKRIKNVGMGNWVVDNSKIKETLGFKPQVELLEGLKKTWRFYSRDKKLLSLKYLLRSP